MDPQKVISQKTFFDALDIAYIAYESNRNRTQVRIRIQ
jgi:hypothetical protein